MCREYAYFAVRPAFPTQRTRLQGGDSIYGGTASEASSFFMPWGLDSTASCRHFLLFHIPEFGHILDTGFCLD